MICIWCQQEYERLSVEHGIPQALGCPEALVMRDVSCARCNNSLGIVDQALVKQFEIATVVFGVRRKKGRRPTIDSWRSITSKHHADGPHIFLNGGPGIVEAEGKRLYPGAKSNRIYDVWMEREANRMGFTQEFGNDPRFVPALYKIGLNLIAKHYGAVAAADSRYDHIRAFVLGRPDARELRVAMESGGGSGPITSASNPIVRGGCEFPLFSVTILGVAFLLDMSPKQLGLRDLQGAATLRNEPLCLLPPKSPSAPT